MTTAMRPLLNARGASLLLILAMPAGGVEHPGVIPTGVECSSCHSKKVTGKSVHSAMSTQCTVCHVARTQGDMNLSLAMPTELIRFACHEKSAELQQHVPAVDRAWIVTTRTAAIGACCCGRPRGLRCERSRSGDADLEFLRYLNPENVEGRGPSREGIGGETVARVGRNSGALETIGPRGVGTGREWNEDTNTEATRWT